LEINFITQKLAQYFSDKPEIKIIGIHGSYAKGLARPDSDIDLCIGSQRPLDVEFRLKISTDLSLILGKEIDLVDLQSIHGVILKETIQNSVWVSRDAETFAGILKRMLLDEADFEPYRKRILDARRERFLKK
jgi:predicted nucleotidyltransferase